MPEKRILIPEVLNRESFSVVGALLPTTSLSGKTMGTHWKLKYITEPKIEQQAIKSIVEAVFASIIHQMSTWETTSEISRFNRLAANESLTISADFQTVLTEAMRVEQLTDGVFTPFCGELVAKWGFGPDGLPDSPPTFSHQLAHKPQDIFIGKGCIQQPGGLRIDLSSIAKGYAVDQCTLALTKLGLRSFLMEIGGEFSAKGVKPDAQPWWVTLEDAPDTPKNVSRETVVALCDRSIATSGTYKRSSYIGNEATNHLIDMKTARPVENNLASVSVIHENCMQADAYATALFCMGSQQGITLANRHNITAIFRHKYGEDLLSNTANCMTQ